MLRNVNLQSCLGISICAHAQESGSLKHEDIGGMNMKLTSAAFYLSSRSFAVSANHEQASDSQDYLLTLLRRLTRWLKMQ